MPVVSRDRRSEAAEGSRVKEALDAGGCTPDTAPVFILAPPRSFTSVIGSMIGQHPQLYGLPELHLFPFDSMAEWWRQGTRSTAAMNHGMLRAVAELYFGGQTEGTVQRAKGWLRRRLHLSTGALLEVLLERIAPLVAVDKSPGFAWRMRTMKRAYELFPQARFIHLTRHPLAHGESVLKFVDERSKTGPLPAKHWLRIICTYPPEWPGPGEEAEPAPPEGSFDPQWGWYNLNRNIMAFLAGVASDQVFRLRGEDVLTDPATALKPLCNWLGLRDDAEAIDEMKHPERSAFACFGPPGARYGMDSFFLENPVLRPSRAAAKSLDGPLPWREDGRGFAPAVRRLAVELGYT
jgi:hypothetical protein